MLIQAQFVEKKDKIEIRNPYTGKVTGTVSALDKEDVEKAVKAAKRYSFSLSGYGRYEILSISALDLQKRKIEFAELITKEIGISLKDSLHEVDRSVNVIQLAAEEARKIKDEITQAEISAGWGKPQAPTRVMLTREPVGIILCITPFNHPLNQVVHKICPAIAANNAVILKPSEKCPLTALRLSEILIKNGLPAEMLQVITGHNHIVGTALIQHPDINMISFTGSTGVGEYIARSCGVKKLSLELGGNDAFVVLPDGDIEKSAAIAVDGAFGNSGQRCSSIKRIIVFPKNANKFAKLLSEKTARLRVGDPMDPSTDIGTVINEEAALNIEMRIKAAVKDGAKLLTGGKRIKAQLWPTVLDYVNPESELVEEETFGPVAPIIRVRDFDEAIEVANGTKYGLNAAIMTDNPELASKFAKRLNVGGIRINQAPSFRDEYIPFGGNKMSGFGRSGVKCAVEEMTNLKTIIVS